MTTTLIDLLRSCLPIHAAWSAAQKTKGAVPTIPDAEDLKEYMKCLGPSDPAQVGPQPVPETLTWWQGVKAYFGREEAIKTARLWDWKKSSPTKIIEVNCRARETGYRRHAVLPSVTFGHEQPQVKVTTDKGQELTLKLEQKYLVSQFIVEKGKVPEKGSHFWPLEMLHDSGLVMLFVYDLNIEDDKVKEPLDPYEGSGKGKWEPLRPAELKLMQDMAPGSVPDKDAWLELMTAAFLQKPGAAKQTVARVGKVGVTKILRHRIVVALSFALMRERADFEPGGLVGMAKVFPNVMVCATLPLKDMEGGVRIERTPATKALDPGDGTVHGTCCNAYDTVGALYVADANEVEGNPQKPFWGGTFAYLSTDADKKYSGWLKMVDRSRNTPRKYKRGKRYLVRRYIPSKIAGQFGDNVSHPFNADFWWSIWRGDSIELLGVEKVPGQGDFDNLHMSPQLKLELARIEFNATIGQRVGNIMQLPLLNAAVFRKSVVYTNEPEKTGTDRVWMAPFCSHDCLHTHWRWGAKESAQWTKGWSSEGPYQESGAPMVPIWQDVEMKLNGPNSYSYKAHSKHETPLKAGHWDIVMHHGLAYAQSIAQWAVFGVAKINMYAEQGCRFIDTKGNALSISHSPLMYWLCRYDVYGKDGKIIVRERLQLNAEETEDARKV